MKNAFYLLMFSLLSAQLVSAQTYCLGYDVVNMTANELTVQLKLQGSTNFKLGSANFRFNYNNLGLSNPTLVSIAPTNSALTTPNPYSVINVTTITNSSARFNVLLTAPNTGANISDLSNWTNLGQVKFTIIDQGQTSGISFNTALSPVYLDDEATQIYEGVGCPTLNVVLPVEMIMFVATKLDKTAQLNWDAITTTPIGQFAIERSADGVDFQSVGEIKASVLNQKVTYSWTDENPLSGINYYRLSWVEAGKKRYSNIRSVIFDKAFAVNVLPNPAFEVIRVDIASSKEKEEAIIELTDLSSRILMTKKVNTQNGITQASFDIINIASGTYIIRVHQGNQTIHHKFIKK